MPWVVGFGKSSDDRRLKLKILRKHPENLSIDLVGFSDELRGAIDAYMEVAFSYPRRILLDIRIAIRQTLGWIQSEPYPGGADA